MLPRDQVDHILGNGSGLDLIHGPERYLGAYSVAVYSLLDGAHVVWAYTNQHFNLENLGSPNTNINELRERFHLFEFPTGEDGGRHLRRGELRDCLKRLRRFVARIGADRIVCIVHSASDLTELRTGREDDRRVSMVLTELNEIAKSVHVVATHEATEFGETVVH